MKGVVWDVLWVLGGRWKLVLGGCSNRAGRVVPRRGAASSAGGHGFIVEEVETTTKAERVVVLVVVDVALRLSPEFFRVLWDSGPRRGRRLGREEGVWLHFAELGCGKPCSSVRKRESTMAPFVNGHCNSVKNSCLTVPSLGRLDDGGRKVM